MNSMINPGRIRVWALILLGIVYISVGIYIFIVRSNVTSSPWGELMSAVFILYGVWRIYRSITTEQSDFMTK